MITRRLLTALPVALAARPSGATEARPQRQPPALPTPRQVRLRPHAPPVTLHAAVDELGRSLTIRFSGTGAPETPFRFTSWYGYGRVFAVLPLRGRQVVLAAFEGNTGTGVYQELQAVIGQEDDGTARILALETLNARETPICHEAAHLSVRLVPDGAGLRLDQTAHGVSGTCDPRRRPVRFREHWTTMLRWDGHGVMQTAPAPPHAGPAQRKVAAARARTLEWLAAAPRSEVTLDDLDRLGLMEVVRTA